MRLFGSKTNAKITEWGSLEPDNSVLVILIPELNNIIAIKKLVIIRESFIFIELYRHTVSAPRIITTSRDEPIC